MPIPLIFHQMWLDTKSHSNMEPEKYKVLGYPEVCRQVNKEFKHMFWDYNKLVTLFEDPQLAKYKSFWYNLPKIYEKCDFARYAIMYLYGGIYLDLDFECYKSFEPLTKDKDILLVWEPKEHGNNMLYNGFLGSTKGHKL